MAYATHLDVVARYGLDAAVRAFDKDGDGVVDDEVEAQALADATDLIDSYIGARFDLPLSMVPTRLKRVCVELAIYLASDDVVRQTEENKARYRDNVQWLRDLSKGHASLALDESPASIDRGVETRSATTDDRYFSRSKLSGLF